MEPHHSLRNSSHNSKNHLYSIEYKKIFHRQLRKVKFVKHQDPFVVSIYKKKFSSVKILPHCCNTTQARQPFNELESNLPEDASTYLKKLFHLKDFKERILKDFFFYFFHCLRMLSYRFKLKVFDFISLSYLPPGMFFKQTSILLSGDASPLVSAFLAKWSLRRRFSF